MLCICIKYIYCHAVNTDDKFLCLKTGQYLLAFLILCNDIYLCVIVAVTASPSAISPYLNFDPALLNVVRNNRDTCNLYIFTALQYAGQSFPSQWCLSVCLSVRPSVCLSRREL